MEIRRSRRVVVSIEAELILDGTTWSGFIGNMSEDGLYMRMPPSGSTPGISLDMPVTLQFQLPSGDGITLQCKVQWINRQSSKDFINSIGMEITEAPQIYKDFLTGRVRV